MQEIKRVVKKDMRETKASGTTGEEEPEKGNLATRTTRFRLQHKQAVPLLHSSEVTGHVKNYPLKQKDLLNYMNKVQK